MPQALLLSENRRLRAMVAELEVQMAEAPQLTAAQKQLSFAPSVPAPLTASLKQPSLRSIAASVASVAASSIAESEDGSPSALDRGQMAKGQMAGNFVSASLDSDLSSMSKSPRHACLERSATACTSGSQVSGVTLKSSAPAPGLSGHGLGVLPHARRHSRGQGIMDTITSGQVFGTLPSSISETTKSELEFGNQVLNRTSTNYSHHSSLLSEAPRRAFVINVRRLIATQKNLALLHELIKSTAIAALTLAQAGTRRQFFNTSMFLLVMIVTWAMHDNRWDRVDIDDLHTLMPLLTDDTESRSGEHTPNPNRLLKGMSITGSPVWGWLWRLLHLTGVTLCTISWAVLARYWWMVDRIEDDELQNPMASFIDVIIFNTIQTEDDGLSLGMQVMVGTLMLLLHLIFEFLVLRETSGVMPKNGEKIWDPRQDGLPLRYRFLGLPSMWFTTSDVQHDMKHWVELSNPTSHVAEIYPQEIAYMALSGDGERVTLHQALRDAKLFDGHRREFVTRGGDNGYESLDIELCFFDSQMQRNNCAYPGEFLAIVDAFSTETITSSMVPRASISEKEKSPEKQTPLGSIVTGITRMFA